MVREEEKEEERGDEWRATRDIEWHVYVCVCVRDALSETNSAWQTEQKGEREGTRDRHR